MTPPIDAAVTIGTATTVAVSYILQAFLALAFGWAGWQFRQARLVMMRLEESVQKATVRLELLAQWKDLHDQRDQERHDEVNQRLGQLWQLVERRGMARGNGGA